MAQLAKERQLEQLVYVSEEHVADWSVGKFASAHDLRRSFGTRWASKVKPATLRVLMRHRFIETTLVLRQG